MRKHPAKSFSSANFNEKEIAKYLLNNPDFFVRHSAVLAALYIPHPTSGAVSLLEYQIRLLRQQLTAEQNRLLHLIARAREYETLAARLHSLILQLLAVNDPDHLARLLTDTLLREFHADAVALKLFAMPDREACPLDSLTLAFWNFIDRSHALCGSLVSEHSKILFGNEGKIMRTAALLPIRAIGQSGILAIGSCNPERFHPDMSTELLDRLGETVSHKLRAVPLGPHNFRRVASTVQQALEINNL